MRGDAWVWGTLKAALQEDAVTISHRPATNWVQASRHREAAVSRPRHGRQTEMERLGDCNLHVCAELSIVLSRLCENWFVNVDSYC